MSNELSFTDNELKSIAVNIIGRSGEAGDKSIMRIGLAVPEKFLEKENEKGEKKRTGQIDYPPKGSKGSLNSGFSVGVFQWDIGQQKNGKEIIEAYNNSEYVKSGKGEAIPKDKVDAYALILQQNRDVDRFGKENSDEKRYDIRWGNNDINKEYRDNLARPLNSFFKTDEGYEFITSLQERHYDKKLKPAIEEILKSPSIQNMNKEDATETVAIYMKLVNQNGYKGEATTYMRGILKDEKVSTKDEIIQKLKDKEYSSAIRDGIAKAIKGAKLYNTLSDDKGKLGEIFREQNGKNPFEIENFHQSPNTQLIDAMFRNPEKAEEFIKNVNNGKDYVINIANEGDNMGIEKEVYIAGVRNGTIFTMQETTDGNGKVTGSSKGYKLEDEKWEEFDNNKEKFLNLKNNDWSINPQEVKKDIQKEAKKDTQSSSERTFNGKTWAQICEEFIAYKEENKQIKVDKSIDRGRG